MLDLDTKADRKYESQMALSDVTLTCPLSCIFWNVASHRKQSHIFWTVDYYSYSPIAIPNHLGSSLWSLESHSKTDKPSHQFAYFECRMGNQACGSPAVALFAEQKHAPKRSNRAPR